MSLTIHHDSLSSFNLYVMGMGILNHAIHHQTILDDSRLLSLACSSSLLSHNVGHWLSDNFGVMSPAYMLANKR